MEANKYSLQSKNGEQFYTAGDGLGGFTYFKYSLSGQTLTIYAWLKGLFGTISLEKSSINMLAMSYKNSLNTLFEGIAKLNNSEEISNNEANYVNTDTMVNSNNNLTTSNTSTMQDIRNNTKESMQNSLDEFSKAFQQEIIKKQEKMCEIGFWLSIFGVLLALVGVIYTGLIYAINFYLASQGLKTRKKRKAIAAIVLTIISLIILFLQLTILSAL